MSFKGINKYILNNFDSLNTILASDEKQDKYCQHWLRHYANIINDPNKLEMIDWEVRLWRAIKEIYASAILYKEAEIAFRHRCMASYNFLLYYALFHAMLSSICFDINIKLNQIVDITHSKVGNIFKGTFCTGKHAIISSDIYDVFTKFKGLREYYSYTPPLNLSMYEEGYLTTVDMYLTQCFQLTNLQSLLLEKSFQKHGTIYNFDNPQDKIYFYNSFQALISKKDIVENNKYILDPADENVLHEVLRDGIGGFQCIGLQLDHTYDEFRTYDGSSSFFSEEGGIGRNPIYRYVYSKII